MNRIWAGSKIEQRGLVGRLLQYFHNRAEITFNADCAVAAPQLKPADFAGPDLMFQDSIVLRQIRANLQAAGQPPANIVEWKHVINVAAASRQSFHLAV